MLEAIQEFLDRDATRCVVESYRHSWGLESKEILVAQAKGLIVRTLEIM